MLDFHFFFRCIIVRQRNFVLAKTNFISVDSSFQYIYTSLNQLPFYHLKQHCMLHESDPDLFAQDDAIQQQQAKE